MPPRPSIRIAVVALLAATAAACGSGDRSYSSASLGRDTVLIDGDAPSCRECSLEIADSVRLGTTGDRLIPLHVPTMLRDSRGVHYLVFTDWGNQPILRYDSAGRFLGPLGRDGDGPGEYRVARQLFIGPNDSVVVFADWRFQIFDANGRFARTFRPATRVRPIGVADDGTIYVTRGLWQDPPPQPAFVIRLGSDGEPIDSFAIPFLELPIPNSGALTAENPVAPIPPDPVVAPDGSVWAVTDYRLHHIDPTGKEKKLLGVRVKEHSAVLTRIDADSVVELFRSSPLAGKSTVIASVDRDGLLWIMRTIAAPGRDTITVQREYLAPHEAPTEVTIPRATVDRLSHSIIEVIDPATVRLLARDTVRFAGVPLAPGYLGRLTTDADGYYVVWSYRFRLRR